MAMLTPEVEAQARELTRRIKLDPLYYSRNVLARIRWKAQEEIRLSIEHNRRTHIRSANGVGKTNELIATIIEWLSRRRHRRVLVTGPTFDSVKYGLWSEIRKFYFAAEDRLKACGSGIRIGGKMGTESWTLGDGWDCRICSTDNPSAAQGARGCEVLVVIDEAQGFNEFATYEAINSILTAEGSRIVLSGNPLNPSGLFFEKAKEPGWHTIRINGYDHPNVIEGREIFPGAITRLWIQEFKDTIGPNYETDPRYIARVTGEFPTTGTHQITTMGHLEGAKKGTKDVVDKRRIGVDVARFGDDQTVIVVFDETRTLIHVECHSQQDGNQIAGRVIELMRKYEVDPMMVKVDVIGVGASVVDALKAAGHRVDAVDFSEAPKNDWSDLFPKETKFENRRAELHFAFAHLLSKLGVSIPDKFQDVWKDLVAPRYEYTSKGKLKVEDKDAIKKRIGRSPDKGDACILAMSNTGARRPRIISSAA